MNRVFNTDIINLIYEFVEDYELLHKKKFKVITKQIKSLRKTFILNYNIKDINSRTYFNTNENQFSFEKRYRSFFNNDWKYKKRYIKFFNKQYEYNFLRKYLPYCIIKDSKDEYTMLNRDYKVIGSDIYSGGGEFLFNDGSTIWTKKKNINEKNLILYKKKIKKLIKNKKCLNYNYHTFDILDIFFH